MHGARVVDGSMPEAYIFSPTGSSPRASLCLSESPCSNGGFPPNTSQNGHAHRGGSPADSAHITQNGLSLDDKVQEPSCDSSGSLPDQPPPLLNGHTHTGLANGNSACCCYPGLSFIFCQSLFRATATLVVGERWLLCCTSYCTCCCTGP